MDNITSVDDFIFNVDKDGNIKSSGYLVNSFLLNSGLPVMMTLNNENQFGGRNISSSFENLAVPAGLFYINLPKKQFEDIHYTHDPISDELYDKLLKYASNNNNNNKKKNTRKKLFKIINNKKTKKSKL
jgi:hypothetical protein